MLYSAADSRCCRRGQEATGRSGSNLAGRQGYLVEIEGHSPQAGSLGIQSSQRLAEAVKRYLVTEHGIPVYRLHSVALGNAKPETSDDAKPSGWRAACICG